MEDTKTASAEVPISLGKPSLRRRLEAYYGLINPASIADQAQWRSTFQQIYEKYGGSYDGERKLATKLAKKYGDRVRLLLAEFNDLNSRGKSNTKTTTTMTQQQTAAEVASIHDEDWFALRPNERNSGIVDVLSDSFDPVAALHPSAEQRFVRTNPWIPACPLLNHIGQFRTYLPINDPLYREDTRNTNAKAKRLADNAKKSNDHNNEKPPARKLGVFAAIAEHHRAGPLALLHQLLENKRQRVRVVVRYVNGIRGTLTGYLVAYDKHYNMILRDVDEVYCPRHVSSARDDEGDDADFGAKKGDREEKLSNLEVELQRRTNALMEAKRGPNHDDTSRWHVRQRHMKQLMVRGDNVVMVYRAESERSAWPRSSKSPAKSVHGRKAVVVPPEERVGTPGSLIYALQRQPKQQQQQQQQQEQRQQQRPRQDRRDYRS